MIFPEEQKLLDDLLVEWYEEIESFTKQCNGIFSERGKHLDRTSAPWQRHDYPEGYAHEIGKKIGRIKQFLQHDGDVPWEKVLDELQDILNYARMMGAIIVMLRKRR